MNTPEQALEKYKSELREYDKWLCEIKKQYRCTKENPLRPMEQLGNGDWDKIQQWGQKIRGMETVLGLSKEEIKKYEDEFFTKD